MDPPYYFSARIMSNAGKKQGVTVRLDQGIKFVLKLIELILLIRRWQPILNQLSAANQHGEMPGKFDFRLEVSQGGVDGRKSRQVLLAEFDESVHFLRDNKPISAQDN